MVLIYLRDILIFMKGKLLFLTIIFALFTQVIFSQFVDFDLDTVDNHPACDSFTIIFTNKTVGGSTYLWNFGNGTTSSQVHDTVTFYNDTYSVRLTVDGIVSKDTTIRVNMTPVANFSDTILSNTGYFTRLFVDKSIKDSVNTPSYTYILDYGDDSTLIDTAINYIKKYNLANDYTATLILYDNLGCADTIQRVISIEDSTSLINNIPNVFTPNNDGINDLFIIEGNGRTKLTFQVFNRSGVLIYKNIAPIITWDGRTLAGAKAPTGVYYYILTSEDDHYEVIKDVLYLFQENN